MKKMMKLWTVVAVTAMGLTACQNNFEEADNVKVNNSVVVSFVAEPTKTSVDTSGDTPLFSWDENETFAVLEQTDALAVATSVTYNKVDGKANIDAEFAANADKGEYKYVAVYPASGYVPTATNINEATLALPAKQSMAEASYDPNADLMVSMVVTTAAQPTEAQQMRFTRLAAVAKMTLKNLTLGEGEVVEKVVFSAEGKTLAGSVTTDLADPATLTAVAGSSSVEVATSSNEVYFTVLPTTLAENDVYGVAVVTNKYLYAKKNAIPAGKSLVFEAGKVSRFSVDMEGVTASDRWVLVRDASTLEDGDVVTLAAKNYDYVVGKQGSNYPIASQTMVVKVGDYLSHPIATESTTADNRIQHYTLMQRFRERTAFDFYNDVDYSGDTSVGFLKANGTYSPQLQAYCDKNTIFDVAVTDGVASVVATEYDGGTSKYLKYTYSSTASNNKFAFASSYTSENNKFCLYKLEGKKRTIPTIDANVTVPDSDEPVVITDDATTTATAIEEVIFNYVGDWTIEVEDNKDWLTVSYANGVVYYTADRNTDAKRDAIVTITATLGDKTLEPWTFNLLQKGAPQEISIAEFGALSKDENSTYKLTGKVTTLATNNSSSGYVLSDENGNTATINYLKDENGDAIWGHDNLTIQLGDIMTVVAVPVGSKKGGNTANPSIYKGHYRLSVSAGLAADYTGGSVAIEVATSHNGNIVLPTTPVTGAMEACDYATFSYNGGADSATVTFTSANETSYAREATVTFTYGLASASVTVQQGINPANKIGWELVTDASTLAVGDEVIIVAKNANKALAKPTLTVTSLSNFPIAEISKTGSVIYDIEDTATQIFTLANGNSENTFAFVFNCKDTDYHIYAPSSGLKGRLASSGANDDTSWSIEISATDGDATIKNARPKVVKYNNATGTAFLSLSPTATNALKAEYSVCIYKKQVK